jgi:hypothetical protein
MLAVTGLGLTALFGAIGWFAWGRAGVAGAVTFGLLATLIQVIAFRLMVGQRDAKFERYLARWGAGMGLRMAGVLVFMVAVALRRDLFPPLASAMGFLGVLLPLLALETRLVQR